MDYQDRVKSFTDSNFHQPNKDGSNWKKLVHEKTNKNKEMIFNRKTLEEASNPLILMRSSELKKDLSHNHKKYTENMTKYSNFYQDVEKAVRMDFLSKNRYSQPHLTMKTTKNSNVEEPYDD